ncbi:MAG: lytic transglycosylase domain-containing protein [Deltaproteobacteria bacterium]|nr:lytic transglycosylase domain-containing protein [Deltaproteobacteria bacterium]MBI4373391.1 lytic transglycosylase domain-containing protein [Deltaproteobacteria bacterium]
MLPTRRDAMISPIQNKPPANGPGKTEAKSTSTSKEVSTPFSKTLGKVQGKRVKAEIYDAVMESSAKHNLPPELVFAVIQQESCFKPNATSQCGASGLMQLMPETAADLGVQNRYDIRQNIDGGCQYLREMLDRFDGRTDLALAAYNAGPGNVEKYNGIPPFEETQNYVQKILSNVDNFSGATDMKFTYESLFKDVDPFLLPDLMSRRFQISVEPMNPEFSKLRRRV